MADPLLLRAGSTADVEPIITLYEAETGRHLAVERLRGFLEQLPSAVAWANSRLIGFGFCIPLASDIAQLGNIFVAEDWRNQGVGSALLRLVEGGCKGSFHTILLCNSMHGSVFRGKRSAAHFYRRNGFLEIWSTGPTQVYAKILA